MNERRRHPGYARAAIEASPRLTRALGQIADGRFSPEDTGRYHGLVGMLYDHDYFLVTCDFDAYFENQRNVEAVFADPARWSAMALANTAGAGWFSSDRAIRGYARDIWQTGPAAAEMDRSA